MSFGGDLPAPAVAAAAVDGWANEARNRSAPPAVIVNPEASPLQLAEWALAQADSVGVILRCLSLGQLPHEAERNAAGALLHFQQQSAAVLQEVCARLAR